MAKILLADDDKHLSKVLARALVAEGHEPILALDGETAVFLARSERPALIVLDVALPGMTGDEVGRAVRRDSALAQVPLIFVSGRDGDRLSEALGSLQPCTFLAKPIDLDELLAIVQGLLA